MAGLLSDIYSASNVAKRKLYDLLGNPVGSLEQMLGNANDRARALNELTARAAQETQRTGKIVGGPAGEQLLNALADAYNPAGITVWHGTPHKFTKFDASKIGSGEGAQSFGHGLYTAEARPTAEEYKRATSNDSFLTSNGLFYPSELEHLNVKAEVRKGNLDNAIELAKKYGKPDADYPETAAKAARDLEKLQAIKSSGGISKNEGYLYKIDLPDEHIAKMIDWDKPLSEQPLNVQAALENTKNKHLKAIVDYAKTPFSMKGLESEVKTMGDAIKLLGMNLSPAKGSALIAKEGIPGIRYLDQGSRGEGIGTSNFVVFPGNEHLLNILEINDRPIEGLLK